MSAAIDGIVPHQRRMLHTDLDAVGAIEHRSYNYPWSAGIFRDCLLAGYGCRVVELGGEVAGFAILSIAAGEAHILNLCVDPVFRRRGLAALLLDALLEEAKQSRVRRMLLEVRPSNLAAIKLYKSRGFGRIGVRKAYYQAAGGREDAMVLALDLDT
jgi:ribosomal-protein-alanine N-acetyltransferase